MPRLMFALALTPALLVTGAGAQTVTEEVTRQLWCAEALIVFFSNPPAGLTDEQLAAGEAYVAGANILLAQASQAHLDAGYSPQALDKLKAELVLEVTAVVGGQNGGKARFTSDECLAILPEPDSSAPQTPSSSSAM